MRAGSCTPDRLIPTGVGDGKSVDITVFLAPTGRLGTTAGVKSTALQRRSTVSRARRSVLSSHLAAVVDYVHDVIVLLDTTGRILFVNRSLSSVTDFDPATQIGQEAGGLVHPGDRPRVLADLRAVTSAGGGTRTLRFRLEHADGHWVPVEARAVNCLHEPTIRGIVLTMRDRRAELEVVEQLEASGARMRALIEALPDGVVAWR